VLRRAHVLLGPGEGGTTEHDAVRQRLSALLARVLAAPGGDVRDLPAEQDPSLAGLLWWKGAHAAVVAVVEVSTVVDDSDIERARLRAGTLQQAGVPAYGTVIGDAWANGLVRAGAEAHHLAWKVGDDVSDAFIAFRRLPASNPTGPAPQSPSADAQ
jgi:hypothetical protein